MSFSRQEKQDKEDIELSHRYRLSLPSSPSQSSFRVLALLFYKEEDSTQSSSSRNKSNNTLPPWVPRTTNDNRTYIVGTNDEPGYMGGAICAERAAMVQLRFLPNFRITKLVIATDSLEPISPGMLCREFLAGHDSVPWDLPVISTGCICRSCGLRDDVLFSSSTGGDCSQNQQQHSIPILQTTLRELYPFPSPYTRLTAPKSIVLGESFLSSSSSSSSKNNESNEQWKGDDSSVPRVGEMAKRLLELAILEAKSNISDLHPIQFGAAVAFADGTIVTSHQSSALEYGCTLDAVSRLALSMQQRKHSPPVLLVQTDQYGIAHGPFAPARAFLTEHGFGDCKILLHEIPLNSDDDETVLFNSVSEWKLREIRVSDLAPNAPSWTTSTDRLHAA